MQNDSNWTAYRELKIGPQAYKQINRPSARPPCNMQQAQIESETKLSRSKGNDCDGHFSY